MHKIFISYHHANDQPYKDWLTQANSSQPTFIDQSVDTGDISDSLTDQQIRQSIRDNYLRDSTVTIVLVGTETKKRKHVDWEIYSSMIGGAVNKKSGVLVLMLPTTGRNFDVSHYGERETLYPHETSWVSNLTRADYETRYPAMPARLIDNLLKPEARIRGRTLQATLRHATEVSEVSQNLH